MMVLPLAETAMFFSDFSFTSVSGSAGVTITTDSQSWLSVDSIVSDMVEHVLRLESSKKNLETLEEKKGNLEDQAEVVDERER